MPRDTGLDARFEAELNAEVPGWRSGPARQAAPGVQHNSAGQRFELRVGGHLAVAEYRIDGADLVLTHTFVPPELRGRGLAEQVVRAALEFAREKKYRVVPQCSYVGVFLRRHPEFADLAR